MNTVTGISWFERMRLFFEDRKDAISNILDAGGCRERWLQGEMFLAFRSTPGFVMNEFSMETGKADMSCARAMVGEVKIIGSHYQRKCVTGGALRPFLGRTNRKISAQDGEILLGPWGLAPDYFRLLKADIPKRSERILVLVADVSPVDTTPLADALRTIDFDGLCARVDLPRGFVRIWDIAQVGPRPRGQQGNAASLRRGAASSRSTRLR